MIDFIKQIYSGKTLGRFLFNQAVMGNCSQLSGAVLDIAGGERPSYLKYLPNKINIVQTDILNSNRKVDMDKPLPFSDNEFENVFLFNAIYIAKNPTDLLKEIHRVLCPGGKVYVSSPLISGEIPEPHDYARYTAEKFKILFEEAKFNNIRIDRVGGRFASAFNLLHSFYIFNTVRLFAYGIALCIDKITINQQSRYPAPIQYFITAVK